MRQCTTLQRLDIFSKAVSMDNMQTKFPVIGMLTEFSVLGDSTEQWFSDLHQKQFGIFSTSWTLNDTERMLRNLRTDAIEAASYRMEFASIVPGHGPQTDTEITLLHCRRKSKLGDEVKQFGEAILQKSYGAMHVSGPSLFRVGRFSFHEGSLKDDFDFSGTQDENVWRIVAVLPFESDQDETFHAAFYPPQTMSRQSEPCGEKSTYWLLENIEEHASKFEMQSGMGFIVSGNVSFRMKSSFDSYWCLTYTFEKSDSTFVDIATTRVPRLVLFVEGRLDRETDPAIFAPFARSSLYRNHEDLLSACRYPKYGTLVPPMFLIRAKYDFIKNTIFTEDMFKVTRCSSLKQVRVTCVQTDEGVVLQEIRS